MANKIKNLGLTTVEGKTFSHVEGGFGEGSKCILARDIAEMHGREVKKINELIKNNKSRFTENDVIDLLTNEDFEVLVKDLGLKTSNGQKVSYLLSERGYAKLLKLLEDNLAWKLYGDLVDGYFNMIANKPKIDAKTLLLADLFSEDKMTVVHAYKELVKLETKPLLDKIEQDKPKVELVDFITKDGWMDAMDFSKVLGIPKLGRNTLLDFFKVKCILDKQGIPYEKNKKWAKLAPEQKVSKNGYVSTKVIFNPLLLDRVKALYENGDIDKFLKIQADLKNYKKNRPCAPEPM